jgi:hypothetical protein
LERVTISKNTGIGSSAFPDSTEIIFR